MTYWFPLPPGTTELPPAPSFTENVSPVPEDSVDIPVDFDPTDIATLFDVILAEASNPPVYPVEITSDVSVYEPFVEQIELLAQTRVELVLNHYKYPTTFSDEDISLIVRAQLAAPTYRLIGEYLAAMSAGQTARTLRFSKINAEKYIGIFTGNPFKLIQYRLPLIGDNGTLLASGQEILWSGSFITTLSLSKGSYGYTGNPASFARNYKLAVGSGTYAEAGSDAQLTIIQPQYGISYYTGTGTTTRTFPTGFTPGFVWTKIVNALANHHWYSKAIYPTYNGLTPYYWITRPNSTTDLQTQTSTPPYILFQSTGYTLQTATYSNQNTYQHFSLYIKEGTPLTTNNDGSVTTQIVVNNTLGFSQIQWDPTGTNITLGHGLGQTPELVILKPMEFSYPLLVGGSVVGTSYYLQLNSISQRYFASQYFTGFTNTTISIGSAVQVNNSGSYWGVAFAFVSKPGVSKIGTYVGDGSSLRSVTGLGFRPGFVMIKSYGPDDGAVQTDWVVFTNKRSSRFVLNNNNAEVTPRGLTFDSDGFTLEANPSLTNANTGQFLYLAFRDYSVQPQSYWMGGAGKNYVLTGQPNNFNFYQVYRLTASVNSINQQGQEAILRFSLGLIGLPCPLAIDGGEANFKYSKHLYADNLDLVVDGQQAIVGRYLALDGFTAVFDMAGQDSAVRVSSRLTEALAATYLVEGQPGAIKYSIKFSAQGESYVFTGYQSSLKKLTTGTAQSGSYVIAGQDAQFAHNYVLGVITGNYSLDYIDSGLLVGYKLDSISGFVDLDGFNSGLTKDSIITGSTESYGLSGYGAGSVQDYKITSNYTTTELAGQNAATLYGRLPVNGEAGSFSLSGLIARASYIAQALAGAITAEGKDAYKIYSYLTKGSVGGFDLTGGDTEIYSNTSGVGSFTLSGQDAIVTYIKKLLASATTFDLTGQDAGSRQGVRLAGAQGSFSTIGFDAGLTDRTAVKLLLNFEDSGAVTYTDSSGFGNVATASGNATNSTVQKKFGNSSLYLDGSGDSLTIPDSTDLRMGTSLWTIEFWVYNLTAVASVNYIFDKGGAAGAGIAVVINSSQQLAVFLGGSTRITGTTAIDLNTWHHVALVRDDSGTNIHRLYLNGIQEGSVSYGGDYTIANALTIGKSNSNTGYINAYIDDFRITKGIPLYFGNFTPPTSSLTKYYQSYPYRMTGRSTSYTLTGQEAGDLGPSIALVLNMSGANGSTTFVDSSSYNRIITANGNAQISTTRSKFDGSSGYFDGSGDFLSMTDSSSFSFGTGEFTFETWVNLASTAGTQTIISQRDSSTTNYNFWWYYTNTALAFAYSASGTSGTVRSISWNPVVNTWYHLAVVRTGNVLKFFLNGNQTGTDQAITTSPLFNSTAPIRVGATDSTAANFLNGYLKNLRVTKGVALYTAAFTPRARLDTSRAPFKANTWDASISRPDPYVSLLLHMDGTNGSTTFVDNSSNAHALTVSGTAAISTAQQKFGTGSATFGVGTGNFIFAAANSGFNFGSGDFTVEFWQRMTATDIANACRFITQGRTANSNFSYSLGWDNFYSSYLFSYSTDGTSITTQYFTITPTADAWEHVAIVRAGGVMNLYLNGVRATATNQSVTASFYAGGDLRIGNEGQLNYGYIDELRITKGLARYTSTSFTPPTSAFRNAPVVMSNAAGNFVVTHQDAIVQGIIPPVASVVTYTGNATNRSITGAGFKPGFVHITKTNAAALNHIFDQVRGATRFWYTSSATAQQTTSTSLTSFNADGFSLGTDVGVNGTTSSYVAFLIRQALTAQTNTNGTITTTVRSNDTDGYSIFTYTGNATSGATIGHGLSSAPEFIIIKNTNATQVGAIGSSLFSTNGVLYTNGTSALTTDSNVFQAYSSSTITVGTSIAVNAANTYVGYAFRNTNTTKVGTINGPGTSILEVNLGFRPAFVILRNYLGATGNFSWYYKTTAGDGYANVVTANNDTTAPAVSTTVSFTSTGFTVDVGGPGNSSGGAWTAIYVALRSTSRFLPSPKILVSSTGSFAYSGFDIEARLQADASSAALTGQGANFIKSNVLRGAATSFALTGQNNNFVYTQPVTNWTLATGDGATFLGNSISTPSASWTTLRSTYGDDNATQTAAFGFNFRINSTNYTTGYVSSNGLIAFGGASTTASPGPSTPSIPNVVFFGGDRCYNKVYTIGGTYQTFKFFKIRWEGRSTWQSGTSDSFAEITFFERPATATQQYVEIRYGNMNASASRRIGSGSAYYVESVFDTVNSKSYVFVGNVDGTSWTLENNKNITHTIS